MDVTDHDDKLGCSCSPEVCGVGRIAVIQVKRDRRMEKMNRLNLRCNQVRSVINGSRRADCAREAIEVQCSS